MRISTLQINSTLGDVPGNIRKADALLSTHESELGNLDLLVLPELAFTGYNHKSFADIEPFLELTGAGPSTSWARATAQNLQCTVAVGYPEKEVSSNSEQAYNSLVFVARTGQVVAHTRKSFLYYTDETWASEGQGFFAGELALGPFSKIQRMAAGICMDINPYKFEAPWTSYEFGNHVLVSGAELVVLSTAWLTRQPREDLQEHSTLPDLETVAYWLERMRPLMGSNGQNWETIVVFANRCGEEKDPPSIEPVLYAGSSVVMGISRGDGRADGNVRIWNMLSRGEEGVLVVDTSDGAKYGIKTSLPAEGLNASKDSQLPGDE